MMRIAKLLQGFLSKSPGEDASAHLHSSDEPVQLQPTEVGDPVEFSLAFARAGEARGQEMMDDPKFWDPQQRTNVGRFVLNAAWRLKNALESVEFSADPHQRYAEVIDVVKKVSDGLQDDEYSYGPGSILPLISDLEAAAERQKVTDASSQDRSATQPGS